MFTVFVSEISRGTLGQNDDRLNNKTVCIRFISAFTTTNSFIYLCKMCIHCGANN